MHPAHSAAHKRRAGMKPELTSVSGGAELASRSDGTLLFGRVGLIDLVNPIHPDAFTRRQYHLATRLAEMLPGAAAVAAVVTQPGNTTQPTTPTE